MVNDKTTIGMTLDNRIVMEKIMKTNLFKNQLDASKFALSLAIKNGIIPISEYGSVDTTWNIGTYDTNNELRDLIPVLYPSTETPYRAIESLMNSGLQIIGKHMSEKGDLSLIDLLKN